MPKIHVTVHTAGAMDGWTADDRERFDVLDTEANLARLLRRDIADATGLAEADITIDVRREDAGDRWHISGARDAMEQRDLDEATRDALIDFPWHDAQRWAVFKD